MKEQQFIWLQQKWSIWMVPQLTTGPRGSPCHSGWQILLWVSLGKNENLTCSYPIFSKAARATLCSSPVDRKPRYHLFSGDPTILGQLHSQRWHHNAHHITLSVLLPQRGSKVFGFKARGCSHCPVSSDVLGSFATGFNSQAVGGGHCVVCKQPLWNHSPRLQLVLIYSGWLQFNTDQYWSGCHNSSLRFASKGSNSFDLPNRENWRAYNQPLFLPHCHLDMSASSLRGSSTWRRLLLQSCWPQKVRGFKCSQLHPWKCQTCREKRWERGNCLRQKGWSDRRARSIIWL